MHGRRHRGFHVEAAHEGAHRHAAQLCQTVHSEITRFVGTPDERHRGFGTLGGDRPALDGMGQRQRKHPVSAQHRHGGAARRAASGFQRSPDGFEKRHHIEAVARPEGNQLFHGVRAVGRSFGKNRIATEARGMHGGLPHRATLRRMAGRNNGRAADAFAGGAQFPRRGCGAAPHTTAVAHVAASAAIRSRKTAPVQNSLRSGILTGREFFRAACALHESPVPQRFPETRQTQSRQKTGNNRESCIRTRSIFGWPPCPPRTRRRKNREQQKSRPWARLPNCRRLYTIRSFPPRFVFVVFSFRGSAGPHICRFSAPHVQPVDCFAFPGGHARRSGFGPARHLTLRGLWPAQPALPRDSRREGPGGPHRTRTFRLANATRSMTRTMFHRDNAARRKCCCCHCNAATAPDSKAEASRNSPAVRRALGQVENRTLARKDEEKQR